MLIALATCSDLKDREDGDKLLHRAFDRLGVPIVRPAWDDLSFDWGLVDACLIRTTWDYTDRPVEFLEWAERVSQVTTLLNPLEVVRWNTHKSYLRDLERLGIPTLPTHWLSAGESTDLNAVLAELGWAHSFLKPAVGATAKGTLRFESTPSGLAEATAHLKRFQPHHDMLLQPYQENVETLGEVSIFFVDSEFTHAVRKVPVPGDYRVQDDFGASDLAFEPSEQVLQLSRRALDAATSAIGTASLYARVDFLTDANNELQVIELELVEPSFFFHHCPESAMRLATQLLSRIT